MPDPQAPSEPQPRPLTERLRMGAARLYPATEPQLDLVRQLVRERWERQQQRAQSAAQKQRAGPAKPARRPPRAQPQPKLQTQPNEQRHGHSH